MLRFKLCKTTTEKLLLVGTDQLPESHLKITAAEQMRPLLVRTSQVIREDVVYQWFPLFLWWISSFVNFCQVVFPQVRFPASAEFLVNTFIFYRFSKLNKIWTEPSTWFNRFSSDPPCPPQFPSHTFPMIDTRILLWCHNRGSGCDYKWLYCSFFKGVWTSVSPCNCGNPTLQAPRGLKSY